MIKDYYLNEYAKDDSKERIESLGELIRKNLQVNASNELVKKIDPDCSCLELLPKGSWLLKIEFTLKTPYFSRSDSSLNPYIKNKGKDKSNKLMELHNPIVYDLLTGKAMVKPSTWKGHLQLTYRYLSSDREDIIQRLFGNECDSSDKGMKGRLRFFPTFFDCNITNVNDVITPLSRVDKEAGPISMTTVKAGTKGIFHLLYTPFPHGKKWSNTQINEDFHFIIKAVHHMLTETGFSAKKSLGWGISSITSRTLFSRGFKIKTEYENCIVPPEKDFFVFMTANHECLSNLKNDDGTLISLTAYKKSPSKPGSSSQYKKFKPWYEQSGSNYRQSLSSSKSNVFEHDLGTMNSINALEIIWKDESKDKAI